MKILIITNHSYMLWRFRRELIAELAKMHEVTLSMPFVGHEDDFMSMGLRCIHTEVDRRGINPITDLKLILTYRKLLKTERPDFVITYSIKPNIYAGLLCAQMGIPYCTNVQGLGSAFQRKTLAKIVTALYKTALRKAKTVFFENNGNAQEFIERNIVTERKITVLNGAGINLEAYPAMPYPSNDKVHFLYMGRIMKEKGIDELFTAIQKLHTKFENQIVLDLVGFFDDDYEAELNQLVADGIAVFHGFQTNPRPYYESADCVVLPSYHEGMSNVLLEAAASGRPVITSDIHGCKEAVIENVSGMLCQPRAADSLYQAMARFMTMPRQEREAMGNAGRLHAETIFDRRQIVENTLHALGFHTDIPI